MFAPLCYPPAGSEAIVTCKLLVAMFDAGWQVDVITQSDYGQYYPSGPSNTWRAIVPAIHSISGIDKVNIPSKLSGWRKLHIANALRTVSWCIKAVAMGLRLASRTRYDLVLSRAAPQYGHLPALFFTVFKGVPWIANWSDPMPQQKAPPPYGGGPSGPIPWYLNLYLKIVARRADGHTFPCERLRRYVSSYLPECEEKSASIPHVALRSLRTRPRYDSSEFSLVYAGTLSYRNPRNFFQGVRLFLNRRNGDTPLHIKFVGLGAQVEGVMDLAREFGLKVVVSIESAKSYEATQKLIAEATALVLIEADCEEGIFFPSKFVDFVQAGRPILALSPKDGTIHDILCRHGGGLAVNGQAPEEVAEAIAAFYTAWVAGSINENFGSEALFPLFSEPCVIERYMAIFDRIKIARAK